VKHVLSALLGAATLLGLSPFHCTDNADDRHRE